MPTTYISFSDNLPTLFVDDGFQALIGKLIINNIPVNSSSISLSSKTQWQTPCAGIVFNMLEKSDFNMVIDSLEKGRKYLDTLLEEEQQEEFVENYIGVMAFDDLKHWVNETLKHCYSDPRYVKPVNE